MNPWIIAYLVGSTLALLLLVFLVLNQQSTISAMKELSSALRDKWAQTEARTKKIEKAVDWFLERRGFKLDYTNITWDWVVVPMHKDHELDECWNQIYRHREEIVYALYEANKKALEDHEKDKNKKGKKK